MAGSAIGERERCESARDEEEGRSDVVRSVGLNYPDVPAQIRLPVYAHNVVRNVQVHGHHHRPPPHHPPVSFAYESFECLGVVVTAAVTDVTARTESAIRVSISSRDGERKRKEGERETWAERNSGVAPPLQRRTGAQTIIRRHGNARPIAFLPFEDLRPSALATLETNRKNSTIRG
ncbi:hypothetical protein ALC56_11878 [Trachymyrmex septentrionalis]|uniref:Uncharacterized protein n=1 Tax=Trachymyrmex septentrionalis TaxID=34720 RepID=A0A195F0W9_9HYME|nr:hypothetical protein ALC56_11878 [Trachymyrmex septentrionalis]